MQPKRDCMKILLAPSETKAPGGEHPFRLESLLFESLLPTRRRLLDAYCTILDEGDPATLSVMFGLKKPDEIARHAARKLLESPAMPAIERYTGVAFDHLDYPGLSDAAKRWLSEHLILHSNLFGFLRPDDPIPEYRLKQGAPVGELFPEKLYRDAGTPLMDAHLAGEEVLDLRAGFYTRVYQPSGPVTVLKFLKGDKVVSHWAKAYRGRVLRALAEAGIGTMEAFMKLPIEGLAIREIQTRKARTEIIYDIAE